MTFFGGRLFKGGVYTREAFIKKYRKNCNSIINVNDFVIFFYSKNGIICFINDQRLESVIRSNGLGRSGSSNTSSCDINCSLSFWQGSPSLKQWIKPFFEPFVLRFKPHDLNQLEGGRLFEGGVYKIIWEKRGAFIRGRRFLEVGHLFEAIRYANFIVAILLHCQTLLWRNTTFQTRGHSHSTYARRRGEGIAKKRMFAYEGEGVLLGQVRTHAKKIVPLFQVF